MRWFKILDGETVAAAEAHETPLFVRRLKNGVIDLCSEAQAQGITALDQEQYYQLAGREALGGDVSLTAEEITEQEYQELTRELPDPEDDDPEVPDGSDERPMTRAELTEAVAALEKANTMLTGMLLENREDDMKASKAYGVGDLIVVNRELYKVVSRIASGAALTVGTNVKKTTLAAELAALNS